MASWSVAISCNCFLGNKSKVKVSTFAKTKRQIVTSETYAPPLWPVHTKQTTWHLEASPLSNMTSIYSYQTSCNGWQKWSAIQGMRLCKCKPGQQQKMQCVLYPQTIFTDCRYFKVYYSATWDSIHFLHFHRYSAPFWWSITYHSNRYWKIQFSKYSWTTLVANGFWHVKRRSQQRSTQLPSATNNERTGCALKDLSSLKQSCPVLWRIHLIKFKENAHQNTHHTVRRVTVNFV